MISAALDRIATSRTSAMTDRAAQLRAQGRDIISLSVGEPDFPTPAHVVAAAKAALDAGETRYTAVGGAARMKAAAALHFARDLGIAVPPEQVTVTAGGKQAIFEALLATLDPGDEVLIPAPWWVSYPQIVRFAGASVVPLQTTAAGGFRITADQLAAAITPRTRWLLLNSPGNPTGAVYPADALRSLGAVLEHHPRVLVLSDDIYAPLRYVAGPHATIAAECPAAEWCQVRFETRGTGPGPARTFPVEDPDIVPANPVDSLDWPDYLAAMSAEASDHVAGG